MNDAKQPPPEHRGLYPARAASRVDLRRGGPVSLRTPLHSRARPGRAVAALLVVAACDVPTELPRWDTRWVVPAENTALAVADLLPAGISVAPSGDVFEVELSPIAFSRSLQELCVACGAVDGLTVPKPPFSISFGDEIRLPDGLLSARLVAGAIELRFSHDFPLDPLRPGALARGHLIISARSGPVELARDSLSGDTFALPPGEVVSRTLPLRAGDVTDPLEIGIALYSPAGDLTVIDLDDRLTVAVPAVRVQVSDPRVRVVDEELAAAAVQIDLGEVDEAVSDRVRSGAVLLRIENPFDISGAFNLSLTSPGTTIVRALEVAPGTSQVRLDLTGDDIRSLLGQSDVHLSLAGRASSPAAGTEVAPDDEIAVSVRIELVVSTGRE